jgi:hypothetical protein
VTNLLRTLFDASFVIVHVAGLGVSIYLLVKHRGIPAVLATVAFSLLLIEDIGMGIRSALIDDLLMQELQQGFSMGLESLNCCCAIFRLAAIVCLMAAIWQAVVRKSAETDISSAR